MKGSKGNDGHHHEEAKRTMRNRDEIGSWNPTGGMGITDGQRKGYSGVATVGQPVTSGAMRGSHTSKKTGGGKGKYPK